MKLKIKGITGGGFLEIILLFSNLFIQAENFIFFYGSVSQTTPSPSLSKP